ncbi:M48 family metallopeptidase [Candidatus Omnitrophota bacterium]
MLRSCVILILAASFTLYGCATTYNPATGQNELIFVTTPVEVALGKIVASKVSNQYKISKDNKKINRVSEIGEQIAAVSDRKDLKYQFSVIEEDGLNAFTTPGGHIYLNSGLMEKANDNELACVIGHEIGHVAARHIAKKLQAQIGYDILMNIATRRGGSGELQKAASISFNLITLGYSREDELLADRLGVKYAHRAGYDPYAMISFLEKLKEVKNEELGVVFLRSHPYVSQRIDLLKTKIASIIESDNKKAIVDDQPKKERDIDSSPPGIDKARPLKVMCPVCRKIFPGRTRYCPYDGKKLQ